VALDHLLGRSKVSYNRYVLYHILKVLDNRAILRLVLFYKSKKKMVLHPTHLIRNIDPSTLEVANDEKFELANIDIRTGTPLSGSLPESAHGTISGTSRSGWAHFGEILWIIRPFIYGKKNKIMRRWEEKRTKTNESSLYGISLYDYDGTEKASGAY
jgi:hypothetical protein